MHLRDPTSPDLASLMYDIEEYSTERETAGLSMGACRMPVRSRDIVLFFVGL